MNGSEIRNQKLGISQSQLLFTSYYLLVTPLRRGYETI